MSRLRRPARPPRPTRPTRHGDAVQLARWHRHAIYLTAIVLAVSGVLWLVFHNFMRSRGAYGEIQHPLTAWWLKIHGAAAMAGLFALGSLSITHIRCAWRSRRNLWSGSVLVITIGALVLTSYLLYYAGDDDLRAYASLVHWIIGLACAAALPLHIALGRRRKPVPVPERARGQ